MLEMVLTLVLLFLTCVSTLSSLGILAQVAAGRYLSPDCFIDFIVCGASWALLIAFLGGV